MADKALPRTGRENERSSDCLYCLIYLSGRKPDDETAHACNETRPLSTMAAMSDEAERIHSGVRMLPHGLHGFSGVLASGMQGRVGPSDDGQG